MFTEPRTLLIDAFEERIMIELRMELTEIIIIDGRDIVQVKILDKLQ
jgi:hypothetical protein